MRPESGRSERSPWFALVLAFIGFVGPYAFFAVTNHWMAQTDDMAWAEGGCLPGLHSLRRRYPGCRSLGTRTSLPEVEHRGRNDRGRCGSAPCCPRGVGAHPCVRPGAREVVVTPEGTYERIAQLRHVRLLQ
jgi:hypothetical protein